MTGASQIIGDTGHLPEVLPKNWDTPVDDRGHAERASYRLALQPAVRFQRTEQ